MCPCSLGLTTLLPSLRAPFLPPRFTPPQKENEVILYGGEWYDSDKDKTHVYSDIYVLNVDKLTWRRVVSPNGCGWGVGRIHVRRCHTFYPGPCLESAMLCQPALPAQPTALMLLSVACVQLYDHALFPATLCPLAAARCHAPATRRCARARRCGCGAASSRP